MSVLRMPPTSASHVTPAITAMSTWWSRTRRRGEASASAASGLLPVPGSAMSLIVQTRACARGAVSMFAPQVPQKRLSVGSGAWHCWQVAPITAAGSSRPAVEPVRSLVARLNSRMESPMARPRSGSLPGPKMSRTMTRTTMRCIGCRAPMMCFLFLSECVRERTTGMWDRNGSGGPGGRAPRVLRLSQLGDDFPAEHHGVVFVGQVVAVGHVLAREGAEVTVEHHRLGRVHRDDVILAGVVDVARVDRGSGEALRGLAVAEQDVVLLHVHVHRVHPAATTVDDLPDLGDTAVGRGGSALLVQLVARLVERVAVDGPLVVVRLEGRVRDGRTALESELAAVVDHGLHRRVGLAGAVEGEQIPMRIQGRGSRPQGLEGQLVNRQAVVGCGAGGGEVEHCG